MSFNFFENANTIISLCSGILSIVMFFLSKKQKDECVKINNQMEQKIQIMNKESAITSSDKYEINKVDVFDNRKTIN